MDKHLDVSYKPFVSKVPSLSTILTLRNWPCFLLSLLLVLSRVVVFVLPGRKLPQQTGTEASLQPVDVFWSTWSENWATSACCSTPSGCRLKASVSASLASLPELRPQLLPVLLPLLGICAFLHLLRPQLSCSLRSEQRVFTFLGSVK